MVTVICSSSSSSNIIVVYSQIHIIIHVLRTKSKANSCNNAACNSQHDSNYHQYNSTYQPVTSRQPWQHLEPELLQQQVHTVNKVGRMYIYTPHHGVIAFGGMRNFNHVYFFGNLDAECSANCTLSKFRILQNVTAFMHIHTYICSFIGLDICLRWISIVKSAELIHPKCCSHFSFCKLYCIYKPTTFKTIQHKKHNMHIKIMKQHIPALCIQTQQQSGSHPHISQHSGATRIQSTQFMLFVFYIIDI